MVGDVVVSTDGVIVRGEAVSLATIGRNTPAMVPFPGALTSHETFVIVGDPVRSADGDKGKGLRTTAVAQLTAHWEAIGVDQSDCE